MATLNHPDRLGRVDGWMSQREGLPSPGAWSIDIEPSFLDGVSSWDYVDTSGDLVSLQTTAVVNLSSLGVASACRLDCTVPRCGDGILDGGEACDDGNTVDGDSCSSDCKSI